MKTDSIHVKLAPHVARTVEHCVILKIEGAGNAVVLNPVAAAILDELRAGAGSRLTVGSLAEAVVQRFDTSGTPAATVLDDIVKTLDSFIENGLLVS